MNLYEDLMRANREISKEENKQKKVTESSKVRRRRVKESTFSDDNYAVYEVYFPSTYEDKSIKEISKSLSAGYPPTYFKVDPEIRTEANGKLAGWKVLTIRISKNYLISQLNADICSRISDKINDPSVVVSTVTQVW